MKNININFDFKKHKKLLIVIGVLFVVFVIFSGMKLIFEFAFFLLIAGVIYQMFFSKKELKQYDPREHNAPEYDKNNYISPLKEDDSYTSPPPTSQGKPFAKEPAIDSLNLLIDDPDITTLGYGKDNHEAYTVSEKEANGMIALAGATGVGKTETIKKILEKPLKNQSPIIIVDGKGSPSFFNDMAKFCKMNNRNFKLFHLLNKEQAKLMIEKFAAQGKQIEIPQSFHYNSLRHGGYTELKDKIISIFDFSEQHYKLQAERFLQGLFKFLLLPETIEITKIEVIDLKVLSKFLNYNFLKDFIPMVGDAGGFMQVIFNEVEESAAKGLANRINSICESELSDLFMDTQDPNVIDIMQSIENNDVIFFSLDSLKFAEYAKMLGRLIIADLKTVAPRFFGAGKKIWCVFDEFNVFADEIVVNLINKTREYGFRNVVSFQELADLIIDGDRKLLSQILGNTNVKIIMRQDVFSSAEEIANSLNTKDIYKVNIGYKEGGQDESSAGQKNTSFTLEEDFIYKPREVLQLGIGEAICFTKFPDFKFNKVKIQMVK